MINQLGRFHVRPWQDGPHGSGGPLSNDRPGNFHVCKAHLGAFVLLRLASGGLHPAAIKSEGHLIAHPQRELHREPRGSMRHGYATDATKVDGITPVTKIDAYHLAFFRVHRVGLHLKPVAAERRNFKAFVGIRPGREMHVAAPGTKSRKKKSFTLAVIAAAAAVKMPCIKLPPSRLGPGLRQQPLSQEACGIQVGHHLVR